MATTQPTLAVTRGASARDLVTLTKPRITLTVLATCATGMAMAPGRIDASRAAAALAGTALCVAAANALNMWWERDTDQLMARTRRRPLPAGRMAPDVALGFGLLLAALSLPLLLMVNALTAALGCIALLIYVAMYTPLKRVSTLALLVGAIPGAMPPLMGWTSVTGSLSASSTVGLPGMVRLGGLSLFALLFIWQVPHFIAISLFRTDDYASAGLKIVPVEYGDRAAKWQILGYALMLLSASLGLARLAGVAYLVAAALLGGLFVALSALGLRADSGKRWARGLFAYSVVYLVAILAILVIDRAPV